MNNSKIPNAELKKKSEIVFNGIILNKSNAKQKIVVIINNGININNLEFYFGKEPKHSTIFRSERFKNRHPIIDDYLNNKLKYLTRAVRVEISKEI